MQINGAGSAIPYFNAGSVSGTGIIIVPTYFRLNAGDVISIVNAGNTPSTLLGPINGLQTPTGALQLVRIE
ncbi:hypothetical protein [Mesobacillus zeae]|uniref:hypothetical protein n=1 Tax=Mesobacillus zeae TaxID=1917180 RepID=UPI00115C8430|nr:hypothetical protein [Mesobacillus zeae]